MFESKFKYQFFAAFIIQILCISHGILFGWLAPILHSLLQTDTPGPFMVTVEQASWIGSFYGLGSLAGNIVFGLILNMLGRKLCLYLVAVPHMIAWIMIYFSKSYVYLYVARFAAGITAGGIYVIVPIFISEISDPSKRGMLCSMPTMCICLGVFFGNIVSSYMEYYLIPCVVIALPIIYLLAVSMFPESPQHLLQKQKLEEARKSYDYYNRNTLAYSMKTANDDEFEELKNAVLKNTKEHNLRLKDFFALDFLKPFSFGLLLIFVNQFSGYFAFFNYMSSIFADSGTAMDPNTCTIITGLVQVVGSCFAMIVIDIFGRKIIMLVSCGGMALGLLVFGFFIRFTTKETKMEFSWVPLALMIFIILIGSIGVLGCILTIIVEILPMKMRSIGSSLCMALVSCAVFVSLKIYPLILHHYGLDVLLFWCGSVCVFSWFCILIFQKETKGLNINK